MAQCKDCIHYEVCDPYVAPNESFPEVKGGCRCFKDKSELAPKSEIIKAFAERLINYYKHLKGQAYSPMIIYHIDQITKEFLEGHNG